MKEPLKMVIKGIVLTDADGLEVMVMEPVTYRNLTHVDVHMIEKTVIGGLIELGAPETDNKNPDKKD